MHVPRMATTWLVAVLGASLARAGPADQSSGLAEPVSPKTTTRPTVAAPEDPWSSTDIAAPNLDDQVIRRSSSRPASKAASPAGQSQAWLRTSFSLAGVVVLIVLLAWGYRLIAGGGRWRWSARNRPGGLIQVLARSSLSPRQALYLVRVGPQLILVGSTHDSLSNLSVINDGDLAARLAGQPAPERNAGQQKEFEAALQHEAQEYQTAPPANPADPDAVMTRVSNLREKLAAVVGRLGGLAARA